MHISALPTSTYLFFLLQSPLILPPSNPLFHHCNLTAHPVEHAIECPVLFRRGPFCTAIESQLPFPSSKQCTDIEHAQPTLAMDEISKDGRSLNLKRSDHSIGSTPTVAASPGSPVHHRPGCHRITSYKRAERDSSDRDAQLESSSSFGIAGRGFGSSRGLGIGNVETRRPVAVGSKSDPSTPLSVDPLLSPSSTREGRNSPHVERHFEDERIHYGEHGRNGLNSTMFEPVPVSSDHERSHRRTASVTETHLEPFGRLI